MDGLPGQLAQLAERKFRAKTVHRNVHRLVKAIWDKGEEEAEVIGNEGVKVVGNTGLEPVTSSMSRKRSSQLS